MICVDSALVPIQVGTEVADSPNNSHGLQFCDPIVLLVGLQFLLAGLQFLLAQVIGHRDSPSSC